jgi:ferredoxin--NADP+ reductase
VGGAPGEVISVRSVSPSLRIVRIGRPGGLVFAAGQHLKVGVAGSRMGSFSIASAPHEPDLELCIELIPDGRLTPLLFALRPGDRVVVSDRPKGAFSLDPTATVHLMVATGSGIGPLRSMLLDALHRGLSGEFVVVHGSGRLAGLPYREELAGLAERRNDVRYLPTVSSSGGSGGLPSGVGRGRVDPVVERLTVGLEPSTTCAYLCGHPGMISSVGRILRGRGVRVRAEAFD